MDAEKACRKGLTTAVAASNIAVTYCLRTGYGSGLITWTQVERGSPKLPRPAFLRKEQMPLPWFRLYHEFADDPKVQSMSEPMQRRLVMLFCSRCKEETLPETLRAFHWRIGMAELAETKALFIANGFIDEDWNLLNWKRRQFLSDSSTERVRNYRARLKNSTLEQDETLQKRLRNGNVTAPDTDTEQKQIKKQPSPRGSRIPENFSVTSEHRRFASEHQLPDPDTLIENFKDYWSAKAGKDSVKVDWDATFRTWMRNAQNFKPNGGLNGHVKESPQAAAARKAIAELDRESPEPISYRSAGNRLF
jgi:hypothetical protein